LAAFVTEFDDTPVAPSDGSVGHLLNRWFENASQDFSPKTALEVRGFIDRNLMPAFDAVPLGKLRTEDVDRFYSELRRRGGQNGKGLAPATVRRIHGCCRPRCLHMSRHRSVPMVRRRFMRMGALALSEPRRSVPGELGGGLLGTGVVDEVLAV
jgi:hypothetical protein